MAEQFGRARAAEQVINQQPSALAVNSVLRNTYMLLGLTILFSAGTAGVSMAMNLPFINPFIMLAGFFGLLFLVHKTANSAWGLLSVFALTGFLGVYMGPIVGHYLAMPNGGSVVMSALSTTAIAFLGLSAFVLVTKKDFSFMRNFLMVGVLVVFSLCIASLFFDLSAFHAVISGMVVLIACGLILWQTSEIVHGGETNYIHATVGLYVQIFNLFMHLLALFGMGGDD